MTDKTRGFNRTDRLGALTEKAYLPPAVSERAPAGESAGALPAGLPEVLSAWLGHLGLLYGVPFNYLVPDPRMLSPESIRFFFVDPMWIESLVDGAFSVGKDSSRDDVHHEAMLPAIRSATAVSARTLRSKQHGLAVTAAAGNAGDGPMTGLLLRSALVSGWPGLEVKAFDGEHPLNPLRIERLSPDVLIALFDGVATRIAIAEPPETLHFGLQRQGSPIPAVMRQDSRVLDVGSTRKVLKNAKKTPLSPADFAIQVLSAPWQWVFEKPG